MKEIRVCSCCGAFCSTCENDLWSWKMKRKIPFFVPIIYLCSPAGWREWDGWPPLARGAQSCHPASPGHPAPPGHTLLLPAALHLAVPGPPPVNGQAPLHPQVTVLLPKQPPLPFNFSQTLNFLLLPASTDAAQTVKRTQREPKPHHAWKGFFGIIICNERKAVNNIVFFWPL